MENFKIQILNFNKSLDEENEKFDKHRMESLNKIMSISCYAQREKAKKIIDFVSDQQKGIALYEYSSSIEESSIVENLPEEVKKVEMPEKIDNEDFEKIERKPSGNSPTNKSK